MIVIRCRDRLSHEGFDTLRMVWSWTLERTLIHKNKKNEKIVVSVNSLHKCISRFQNCRYNNLPPQSYDTLSYESRKTHNKSIPHSLFPTVNS